MSETSIPVIQVIPVITFEPSYQNKSCSQCQQDVRKLGKLEQSGKHARYDVIHLKEAGVHMVSAGVPAEMCCTPTENPCTPTVFSWG